jgi:uridylate kinase
MTRGFRRALLKISGEALAGAAGYGLDQSATARIAAEIAGPAKEGRELGVVIGGGNILRGVNAASLGLHPLTADHMGMIATVINAMALAAALEVQGVEARVMSAFQVGRFVETFQREKALELARAGIVLVFAGGTGNPCFTTDSAAALRAVEIGADVLIKATQVPGVFDKDPKKHPDAVLLENISPEEFLQRRLEVLDAASVDILRRKGTPVIVLDLHIQGNIARALNGEKIGSIIA